MMKITTMIGWIQISISVMGALYETDINNTNTSEATGNA